MDIELCFKKSAGWPENECDITNIIYLVYKRKDNVQYEMHKVQKLHKYINYCITDYREIMITERYQTKWCSQEPSIYNPMKN